MKKSRTLILKQYMNVCSSKSIYKEECNKTRSVRTQIGNFILGAGCNDEKKQRNDCDDDCAKPRKSEPWKLKLLYRALIRDPSITRRGARNRWIAMLGANGKQSLKRIYMYIQIVCNNARTAVKARKFASSRSGLLLRQVVTITDANFPGRRVSILYNFNRE